MPSSEILLLGDPRLRKRCVQIDPSLVDGLLSRMFNTMVAENGIGLASNQIGDPFRVFILKDGNSYKEYINPEILSQEELVDFEGEGCLSIPGASATTKRFRRLTLTWLDRFGTKYEEEFLYTRAFAVQHEMDHQNGKLYIDQFGPVRRDIVISKHKKHLRALERS